MARPKPEKLTERQKNKSHAESIDKVLDRYFNSPVGSQQAADAFAEYLSRKGESPQEPESSDDDDD